MQPGGNKTGPLIHFEDRPGFLLLLLQTQAVAHPEKRHRVNSSKDTSQMNSRQLLYDFETLVPSKRNAPQCRCRQPFDALHMDVQPLASCATLCCACNRKTEDVLVQSLVGSLSNQLKGCS